MKVLHSICLKFGKLSSGHRTGKVQVSFQSQRKAMPKNVQTTAQLHASHTLATAAATAKSCQSCSTLCDPIDSGPPRLPRPWDSPGKNTGVGGHFLLQCMQVKSDREVTQSYPTLRDPMDCSLPGSSIHGICQARVLQQSNAQNSASQASTLREP